MNSTTKQRIQQIKSKLKSPITKQPEFANDDAVIDLAIQQLHQDLKQRGLL